MRVAKAAAAQMVGAAKAGAIINIGSIYGLRTGVLKVAYNVSKAGIVQLTKSMAMELCRHNIRVNALCPGWFPTEITEEYFQTESGKRYVQTIPMKRMGVTDDLTVPLLLLASNKAGAYVTGSTLTVDGGLIETPV
jgi:NAD(P)-dependent dehydrogenase (short-subunit alcohol dehydrogenase family)